MTLRVIAMAGGLAGAAATSQFPEYSQQYLQRLGGAVDALEQVVADFDASAQAAGLSRTVALTELRGSVFLERRQADMAATFARHDRLSLALDQMQGHGPFMRAYHLPQAADAQIARAALAAYQPALPLNFAGFVFAGVGYVLGAMGLGLLMRLLVWPLRRRRTARAPAPKDRAAP